MQSSPLDEYIGEGKLYTISDIKFVKTFYANGNFQYQLTTKKNDILEIGSSLNLQQVKMLLDEYATLVSILHATFYKGENFIRFTILPGGIYASLNFGYFCLDLREFYINKKNSVADSKRCSVQTLKR